MKKSFTILAVVLLTFVLVGCGSKKELKLNCDIDYTSQAGMPSGVKMLMSAEINFENKNKIKDMAVSVTFELNDTYKSQIDKLMSSMESSYKTKYTGEHFKVTTEKVSDNSFTIKIFMDYKNMSDTEKKNTNLSGSNLSESYELNKSQLEKEGFTCK